MKALKESAQRVQNKLLELGYTNQVIELPENARTAQEAAEAIGCKVAQIGKSIIFRLETSDRPLLIVASGINRINEKKLANQLHEKFKKADADFVREHTGFVIGGVPPLGHAEPIITLIDEDLLQYDVIWVAAGHPKAIFRLTPEELVQMTKGQVVCVK
ncbi:Cys-tRNA(Pro) deacylase, prolyl-tRNA editing enzyme YbaK/EbsC [Bacillus sp. 491mf]|uniref:YbaK/EbsC family protein n=1 Tax=Bacillus sp. 491mf TaxID=1761755 RepID=UPI0008EBF9F6|nr:YbaK/EbsC family protein [Bacillus sp. 491mf]SFC72364.1 Cys-tRNA(Pro) deacylase, prolyl-tRNA editing enzyme YbaK/EbsC [Bacillus sp. 491mf]